MTWNVRRPVPTLRRNSPDRWERRRSVVRAVLQQARPSLLGVQEAVPEQLAWIAESTGAEWIGRGRSRDGGGEHCAVLYDPSRLRVLRWEQHALSRTPAVAGSRSWGSALPRVFVVADFADRATGIAFRVINTHLDHVSPLARRRSAELLRRVARARWGTWRDPLPTVLLGDANASTRSVAFRILTVDLADAWTAAARRSTPEWGTRSAYRPPRPGRRIDWILASPDIAVDDVAIAAVRIDGRAGSDHDPVQAVLRLPARSR
ncbi:endonuclease/exonuclease/phosphatase family protein [Naasia sp. SYSU D00057]|uniref:endonuclease/exonuclease/phosphatase family protein n=1 Tax=Naasia sp. SYSU D00057 TaxID=2817380 RepID=UPI001B30E629|nr:endonuclease/exonuclease/phosphatase family protein [Naasia sp. SYSU D00057]